MTKTDSELNKATLTQEQSTSTSSCTTISNNKQQIANKMTNRSNKDNSTVLTVSNLIAAHGNNEMDCLNNNRLIKTTPNQLSKTSLSSLNSNTSSESTILILQNTDLINENAFLISSSSRQPKQQIDQKEKETSKSENQNN